MRLNDKLESPSGTILMSIPRWLGKWKIIVRGEILASGWRFRDDAMPVINGLEEVQRVLEVRGDEEPAADIRSLLVYMREAGAI